MTLPGPARCFSHVETGHPESFHFFQFLYQIWTWTFIKSMPSGKSTSSVGTMENLLFGVIFPKTLPGPARCFSHVETGRPESFHFFSIKSMPSGKSTSSVGNMENLLFGVIFPKTLPGPPRCLSHVETGRPGCLSDFVFFSITLTLTLTLDSPGACPQPQSC